MKTILKPFLALLLMAMCLPAANAQSITIADSGVCVSTTLTQAGVHDGKPFFSNGGAGISLYWDAGDARWELDGSNATPGTNTFVVWVNSADTPNPPELAIGGWTDASGFCNMLLTLEGSGTTLPVEFLSFTGQPANKNVVLNWQTVSETDNEMFEVEGSRDGRAFQKIGEVAAEGTTAQQQDYSFVVNTPGAGTTYYRLKQIDFDGQFDYSEIININFEGGSESFGNLYPNPSKSGLVDLNFTSENNEELQVTVFDVTGKLVANQKQLVTEGSNVVSFDFSTLNSGVYVVKVGDSTSSTSKKLVIEK